MKIQTLNKQQEKKLLNLCKEFFPKSTWQQIIGINYGDKDTVVFYEGNEKEGWLELFQIHWYQLCLTELPKRIFHWGDLIINGSGLCHDEEMLSCINSSKHPVDFLYQFVQECKKNKYFKDETRTANKRK